MLFHTCRANFVHECSYDFAHDFHINLLNAVQFPHYFVKCSAMYNNYTSNYCQVFFGTTC